MPRKVLYIRKLDEWISVLEGRNHPTSTVRLYRSVVQQSWEFGEKDGWDPDPRNITPGQVRRYLEWQARYAPLTQALRGTVLLIFLRWAKNRQLADFQLRIRAERMKADWLTPEEVSAVLSSAPSLPIRAAEIMFAYTGVRVSELVQMRVEDLTPEYAIVRRGKGWKTRRVPLTPWFWEAMRPYMEWRRTQPGNALIVHGTVKRHPPGPYTADGLTHALEGHGRTLGRHLSPHTFRRSFGRHLYLRGMPLPEIQQVYGHSKPEMTLRYIGITDDDLSSSMTRFQPRY